MLKGFFFLQKKGAIFPLDRRFIQKDYIRNQGIPLPEFKSCFLLLQPSG